jgi:hypothetical protein
MMSLDGTVTFDVVPDVMTVVDVNARGIYDFSTFAPMNPLPPPPPTP